MIAYDDLDDDLMIYRQTKKKPGVILGRLGPYFNAVVRARIKYASGASGAPCALGASGASGAPCALGASGAS